MGALRRYRIQLASLIAGFILPCSGLSKAHKEIDLETIKKFKEEASNFDVIVNDYLKKRISNKQATDKVMALFISTYGGDLKKRLLDFSKNASLDGDHFSILYANRLLSCGKPTEAAPLEYEIICVTRIQNGESNWVPSKEFITRYGLVGVSQKEIDKIYSETKGEFSIVVKETIQLIMNGNNRIEKVIRNRAEWIFYEFM